MYRTWTPLVVLLAPTILVSSAAFGNDSDRAVKEIVALLEAKNIDRTMFPKGSFDPSCFDPEQFDPMLLEATWEQVRGPIQRILRRRLGIAPYEDFLKLYVAKVSEAGNKSGQYKVVFLVGASVQEVLMRSLSLPEGCFPKSFRPVWETRTTDVKTLTVSWDKLGEITSGFVSSSPRIRQLGFAVRAPVYLPRKVQVFTSWRRYERHGGYDLYWRLFFQVKRAERRKEEFLVTVRGQVARNLPGASTNRMEYLGSEEFDSKFELPIGTVREYKTEKFVPDVGAKGSYPEEPFTASSSGQLAAALLSEYFQLLTN